jgi:cytoskeletal protein CcmA (bactofilin family)
MNTPKTEEFAHIGKSVVIKGELSGSEDLYLDGSVEGTIELHSNSLIIGPNGRVRASVHAKGVVVHGKLEGDIQASERAELRKTAVAVGDIVTQRIAIEEGAYFKGKVDIQKEAVEPSVPPARPVVSMPAASAAGATSGGGAGAAAPISGIGGVPGGIKNSSN